MRRVKPTFRIWVFAFALWAGQAAAQTCPDFFRFVDFGIVGYGGSVERGGTMFRMEKDGTPTYQNGSGVCRDVASLLTDGRGQKIPVVDKVGYLPELVAPQLTQLSAMRALRPASRMAEENAFAHQSAQALPDAERVTGADHLCIRSADTRTQTISCEVVNPFDPAYPLVIYCDALTCTMPVLAIDDVIILTADWERSPGASLAAVGQANADIVAAIHAFIAQNMSRS